MTADLTIPPPTDDSVSTRICIVRHGETDWNAERRVQGQIDIPLNPVGLNQAKAAARGLAGESFSALYSSDLLRARQTAQQLASRHGLPLRVDAALRERHYGILQALTAEEARICHPQASLRHAERDPDYAFEGGESLVAFARRVLDGFEALGRRHAGETLLVVTHGGVLDILYRHATGRTLQGKRDFAVPNAAFNWLERAAEGWRVLAWADRRHLEAALDELPG